MISEHQAKVKKLYKLTNSYPEMVGFDINGNMHRDAQKINWLKWLRKEHHRINKDKKRTAIIARTKQNGEYLYSLWVDNPKRGKHGGKSNTS